MTELTVHRHDGDAAPEPPGVLFAFDFASAESYVALERFVKPMATLVPELVPVHGATLGVPAPAADGAARERIERLAAESQLLPLDWPAGYGALDTRDAVTVAGYAKTIGKVAVFSLSLFRQIYAAGGDPADRNTLYLAAVASEIHPRAVDQALRRDSQRARADAAAAELAAAGVGELPALRIGERLLTGSAVTDAAGAALGGPQSGD